VCLLGSAIVTAEVKGFDDDVDDGGAVFATLVNVDSCSGQASAPPEFASCTFNPPNTVFAVGFTSGYAFVDNTLYGLNWLDSDIFLHTLTNVFCASGTTVGAQPVSSASETFRNLQSLAYCPNGMLYSVDFDFAAHTGRLIEIDPTTGLGEVIGAPMGFDVRVVGMSCDSLTGTLWAVTSGFGVTRPNPELFTIDPDTGVESLVGPTGLSANDVESLTLDGLDGDSFTRLIAAGAQAYELHPETGAASLLGGNYYGELWALASRTPGTLEPGPCGDVDESGIVTASDVLAYRQFLADPGAGSLSGDAQNRCSVSAPAGACRASDVAVLVRTLACPSLEPGIQQVCPAY
jgi:hypothetical protein